MAVRSAASAYSTAPCSTAGGSKPAFTWPNRRRVASRGRDGGNEAWKGARRTGGAMMQRRFYSARRGRSIPLFVGGWMHAGGARRDRDRVFEKDRILSSGSEGRQSSARRRWGRGVIGGEGRLMGLRRRGLPHRRLRTAEAQHPSALAVCRDGFRDPGPALLPGDATSRLLLWAPLHPSARRNGSSPALRVGWPWADDDSC